MKTLKIIAVNVCRMVVAVTFVLSGFVKAVDPAGTNYKIADYLEALSLQGMVPESMITLTSVTLSALEAGIGARPAEGNSCRIDGSGC